MLAVGLSSLLHKMNCRVILSNMGDMLKKSFSQKYHRLVCMCCCLATEMKCRMKRMMTIPSQNQSGISTRNQLQFMRWSSCSTRRMRNTSETNHASSARWSSAISGDRQCQTCQYSRSHTSTNLVSSRFKTRTEGLMCRQGHFQPIKQIPSQSPY